MGLYKVNGGHINHDGKQYAPGDNIELTPEQAKGLWVVPLEEEKKENQEQTNKEIVVILEGRKVEIPPKATKPVLLELLELINTLDERKVKIPPKATKDILLELVEKTAGGPNKNEK